jgi:hypothetical protein
MTQPRRAHPHEHFARARRIEIDLDDLQRPRLRVRPGQQHFIEYSSAGFHVWNQELRLTAKARKGRENGQQKISLTFATFVRFCG